MRAPADPVPPGSSEYQWLSFTGIAPQIWPMTLDLVDCVSRRRASPMIAALARVIAPRFDEVEWSDDSLDLANVDIGADLDSDRTEQFLRRQVLRALASEKVDVPQLQVRGIPVRDTDRFVIARLRRLSGEHSAKPGDAVSKTREKVDWSALGAFSRLVGASCQGVPEDCVKHLAGSPGANDAIVRSCEGPDGSTWWQVRPDVHLVLSPRGRPDLLRARRELVDRWPLEGWDYVRRLCLLLRSRPSLHELIRHYEQALHAYSSLWRTEDFWRYMASLVLAGLRHDADDIPINWVAAAISLGRIAPNKSGERIAIRLLEQGYLKWGREPLQRARIQYELGNLHARLRTPRHIAKAESCLDEAQAELRRMHRDSRVDEMEAQVANTRALAAYHSQQNERALRLEMQADSIARSSPNAEVRRWADVTLALNRAQLIERRFGDTDGALSLIQGLVDHHDTGVRAQATCSVARILLQKEDWAELLRVASAAVDDRMFRENEEMFLRVVRALALAKLGRGEDAQAECRRIITENLLVQSRTIDAISSKLLASLHRAEAASVH